MLDDAAFVKVIEQNVLHQAPTATALEPWTTYLHDHSRAELVVALLGTAEDLILIRGIDFERQRLILCPPPFRSSAEASINTSVLSALPGNLSCGL
jgi:hypothetical protein